MSGLELTITSDRREVCDLLHTSPRSKPQNLFWPSRNNSANLVTISSNFGLHDDDETIECNKEPRRLVSCPVSVRPFLVSQLHCISSSKIFTHNVPQKLLGDVLFFLSFI